MQRTLLALIALAAASTAAAQSAPHFVDRGNELLFTYGPLALPARGAQDAMLESPALTVKIPADGWMRGIDVDLVDARGRLLPRRLLHHVTAMTPDERDLFSPVMMRVGAAGAETAAISLPRFIGLRVHRGDSLFVVVMLRNASDTAYGSVTVRVHVPFTHASSAVPALSIYPLSVAIGPKDKPNEFDLPPGRSVHYWEGSPAVAVRVLGFTGHLHQYGVLLRFEDRTAKKVLWEARPKKDSTGQVLSMPVTTMLWRFGKPMYPSHVYRLTAVYDNPTARTIPSGGMGVLAGVVVLSHGTWPKVDRSNPEYTEDLANILHTGGMEGMSMP